MPPPVHRFVEVPRYHPGSPAKWTLAAPHSYYAAGVSAGWRSLMQRHNVELYLEDWDDEAAIDYAARVVTMLIAHGVEVCGLVVAPEDTWPD